MKKVVDHSALATSISTTLVTDASPPTTLLYISLSSESTIKNSFHDSILKALEPHFSKIIIFCWGNIYRKEEGKREYCSGTLKDWHHRSKSLSTITIIYANDHFLGGLFGAYLKKRKKVPLVVRIGSPWKYSLTSPINLIKQGIINLLQPYILKRSDLVIYNSQALVYPGVRHHFLVIYNGVDTTLFHPPAKDKRLGKVQKKLRLIFIGNLNKEKGLDYLFAAVEKMPDVSLAIVGDGPLLSYYRRKYPQVSFLGKLPHADLPNIINQHDIVVHPSYVESIPNVILEAMACGKPVIAARVYGIPEVITDGENGLLVPKKDALALRKAIFFLQDKNIRQRLGRQALQTIRERFEQKKQVGLVVKAVISSLVSSSPSAIPTLRPSGKASRENKHHHSRRTWAAESSRSRR